MIDPIRISEVKIPECEFMLLGNPIGDMKSTYPNELWTHIPMCTGHEK